MIPYGGELVLGCELYKPSDAEVVSRLLQVSTAPMFIEKEIEALERLDVKCLVPDGSRMANRLKGQTPRLLFCRGSLDGECPIVAIVGTRRPDEYGLDMARRLAQAVASAGGIVISGGAIGIDTAAHEGALEAGGRTVVVLGNGFSSPYPAANQRLFERIVASGSCLLTEYLPSTPPKAFRFPERNRIIAAIADAVVVVQARSKSGALITAEIAAQMGVPVFAVPGDAWYETSEGPLMLIRSGARPVTDPTDLASVPKLQTLAHFEGWPRPGNRPFGLQKPWREGGSRAVMKVKSPVLDALSRGANQFDEIVAMSGLSPAAVQAGLLELELACQISRLPGGVFVITGGSHVTSDNVHTKELSG